MKKINCILIIDDNDSDNAYHKIIIKKAGVCNQIRIVLDGLKALDYILNSAKPGLENDYPKPDLIFLDVNMPHMNGLEFLEEYHKLDEAMKSSIVITMLTTSLNPDDEKKAMNIKEASEFKNKPLTLEMLHEIAQKYF